MKNEELITRQESAALRGIAILAIMLHNYCHWLPMVQENEYTYTQGNVDRLLAVLCSPGQDILAHLLSFFGHYGVPVFVFLSAYGLVKKYESPLPASPGGGEDLNSFAQADNKTNVQNISKVSSPRGGREGAVGAFIYSHYRKLFLMMIVGYTAFVMVDYMTPGHRHYEFWNVIGQLGMFSNFYADPDHDIWPGPYWYFGLMVQIYVVYRLILYKGKGSLGCLLSAKAYNIMLVVLFIATLSAQLLFEPTGLALQWYRYNVFGSLPVFIAGLWYARSNYSIQCTRRVNALIVLAATLLIIAGSMDIISWTIVPFFIVVASLCLVRCMPQCILNPLAWVGSISAAMFVCHPITRKVLIPISRQGDLYTGLILYLVATIILAILFKHIIAIVSGKK